MSEIWVPSCPNKKTAAGILEEEMLQWPILDYSFKLWQIVCWIHMIKHWLSSFSFYQIGTLTLSVHLTSSNTGQNLPNMVFGRPSVNWNVLTIGKLLSVDGKLIVLIRGEVTQDIISAHSQCAPWACKGMTLTRCFFLGENLIISNSFIFISVFPSYHCFSPAFQKGHMEQIVQKRIFWTWSHLTAVT